MPPPKRLFMILGPWSFLMSVVSITAGSFLVNRLQVDLMLYLLAVAMVIPVHAGANLLNDCFDVITGADRPGMTVYKPHPILTGVLSLEGTVTYAASLLALGFLPCIGLILLGRPFSILILLAAIALMLSYNLPPVRLKERGLGELLVFIVWGPLMFVGSAYLQTDLMSAYPVLFSIPIGLLVASVLLVDDMNDMQDDASIGRRTIPNILGKRGSLILYVVLVASSYLLAAVVGLLSARIGVLIVLVSLPVALGVIGRFRRDMPRVSPDRIAAQLMVMFGIFYALGLAL